MNQKAKHFLIVLALSVCLFLTLVLVVSCYDNVAFKYETKYIESEINRTICVENERIRCTYPSYHKGSNKIEMYFEIHDETHGQEKEGELERMCEIADYISRYIKNNPESFLCGKKITLSSESCDRLGDVKICNFDPETDETFSSSEQFHYGYFDGYFYPKEDFSLSKLERFDWFEILEFTDMTNDNASSLLHFPQLKEIRCERDFFTTTEQERFRSKDIFLSFIEI
ncbi:hypothetical protein [Ruminococcus callidus]|jgi:hypothetical protein|uniref:hypothetical protein n=1 Tax=Ruminococcus callidus TaxID=40519 RepID=UPI0023F3E2CA|nr:hypothetical protein [Ruminococcus callidus]